RASTARFIPSPAAADTRTATSGRTPTATARTTCCSCPSCSDQPMWHDPAAHARDFAERYAEPMDYLAAQRMMDLGIPLSQIGRPGPDHGGRWRTFFPHDG